MNTVQRASPVTNIAVIGVASIGLGLGLGLGGCAPSRAPATQATTTEDQVTELQVKDIVVGQGAEATAGARVTVHYTGWLYDRSAPDNKGKEFDSSRAGASLSASRSARAR